VVTISLRESLTQLQESLATVDLLEQRHRPGHVGFLVKRLQNIRVRMDANRNHKRPHLHIDYGKSFRTASFAIDTGEVLAGDLPTKYQAHVTKWIDENLDQLKRV
jgi:hypothetical protein